VGGRFFGCGGTFPSADGFEQKAGQAMGITMILAEGLLDFSPVAEIWVLGIFIILVIILQRTAWKNVLAGLKSREERIRRDIADAESARMKSEQSLDQYNAQLASAEGKVRDILSQAAIDAEKIGTSIRMRAQQEAEEAKERAMKEIESAKDAALVELHNHTAELATSIAEKIIRRNLNPNDQHDLVQQSLDQLQNVGQN
jgi:F-type H+-transporting ATPase subunit b